MIPWTEDYPVYLLLAKDAKVHPCSEEVSNQRYQCLRAREVQHYAHRNCNYFALL
jgi:hypothetical protein